jgi:hypothetical protein
MNSHGTTWKVRRIGQTLWFSVRTGDGTPWSWIERVHRAARPLKADIRSAGTLWASYRFGEPSHPGSR